MIVLDTNVVSETLKPQPDTAVSAWPDAQLAETLHLSFKGGTGRRQDCHPGNRQTGA
jgi:hypothetical protein